ncbi:protein of unknown function [Shewanella benthica]|uniref:Uncharacterized protein n=1 Tax=Shewanella benthica TaxID=43661 RepID=A0A330M641_9GAMM|nr:protein of unknown function [Shewanella benthica]
MFEIRRLANIMRSIVNSENFITSHYLPPLYQDSCHLLKSSINSI